MTNDTDAVTLVCAENNKARKMCNAIVRSLEDSKSINQSKNANRWMTPKQRNAMQVHGHCGKATPCHLSKGSLKSD